MAVRTREEKNGEGRENRGDRGIAWRRGERETIRFEALLGHFRLRAFERIRDEQTNTASSFSKKKRRGHANSYLMASPRSVPGILLGELVLVCGKASLDESIQVRAGIGWTKFFFLRLNKIFVKNIERISKLYYPYRDLLRKNTAYRSKNLLQNIQDLSQSLKNQRISKRKIPIPCIPLEHTFITDTFISTFSPTKLDFFKEELPLSSSRAKGHPTSLNHNIIEHVHIYTHARTHTSCVVHFHMSPTDKEEKKEESCSTLESSYHLHSLVGEATCLSRTLASERARVLHNFTNRAYNRRCKTRLRFDRLRGH